MHDLSPSPRARSTTFHVNYPHRPPTRTAHPLTLPALPAALAGVDLPHVVRVLEAELRRRGARTQARPVAELFAVGKLPGSALATFVLESDRIARAVVSHLRVPPFMAGLALIVHPRSELQAPLLLADLTIAPTGRARALLDAAGPAIAHPAFADDFAGPLARVIDGASGPKRSTVPAWLAHVSGGGGGTLRSERGGGAELADVFVRYVGTYLSALDRAPQQAEPGTIRANGIAARTVRDLVRANGPAKRWLVRAFGEFVAERYLRVFWREDEATT
jgi:hypothetical protein